MARPSHYIINVSVPGFLPEGEPVVRATHKLAVVEARRLAGELRADGFKVVSGTLRPAPPMGEAVEAYKGHSYVGKRGKQVVIGIGRVPCHDPTEHGDCPYCQYELEQGGTDVI